MKIKEVAQNFWPFFQSLQYALLIVTRNVLGYISGDFFTNSSGHPGPRRKWFL
jgi:hypothetical protein